MSLRPRFALALFLFTVGAAIAGAQNSSNTGGQTESASAAWLSLNIDPGSYRTDIALSLSSTEEGSLRYRLPDTPAGRFVTYREPILLTALPGEERLFPLQIQLVRNGEPRYHAEFTYAVDKLAPAPLSPRSSRDTIAPGRS